MLKIKLIFVSIELGPWAPSVSQTARLSALVEAMMAAARMRNFMVGFLGSEEKMLLF